ncbi:MAG: bifunctional 4-hydroxy-2-oxoglutarate aldolase/2-dehydro-3-deoxy-phosphogluconate aldolase [Cellvibrionaceae bacterium]
MQTAIDQFINKHLPVLPIVTVHSASDIIPIIYALSKGGINAIEITLRTDEGLKALELARLEMPNLFLCAGSVSSKKQVVQAAEIGADLIISPGISRGIIEESKRHHISLLPGISTPSDILLGLEYNLQYFKLFPAEPLGGIDYLNSIASPFPDIQFCPTGGINKQNYQHYLNLKKVAFVGGSWLLKEEYINEKNWAAIEEGTKELLIN